MKELGLVAKETQLETSHLKQDISLAAKASSLSAALQDAGTRAVIETMIQQNVLKNRQEEEVDALCRLLHSLKQTHRQTFDLRLDSSENDTVSFVRSDAHQRLLDEIGFLDRHPTTANMNDSIEESLKSLLLQINRRVDTLEENKASREAEDRIHDLEERIARLELSQVPQQVRREVVTDTNHLQLADLREALSKEIEGIKGRLDSIVLEIEAIKAAKSNLDTTQSIQDEVTSIKNKIAELDKSLTGEKDPSSPAEGDLERIWIRGYGYTEARLFPLGRSMNKADDER
eukprot:749332-Hanusia_phi.AAC.2